MSTSAQLAANVNPQAFSELCKMYSLPPGVEAAFHALCIVFCIPAGQAPDAADKGKTHPDYFRGVKRHVYPADGSGGSKAFLAKMAAFDFASLTKEQFSLLTPIVEHPDFTLAFMAKKSSAATSIVAW